MKANNLRKMVNRHQNPRAWVEPVEKDLCCLCADEGKERRATHVVKCAHYFSYLGLVAAGSYCEKHANEMVEVFRKQLRLTNAKLEVPA